MALTGNDETVEFPFSHAWTVPSTVLHLSSGLLSLKNITFLVADDDGTMVFGDPTIGLSVSRHLRVGIETLLEANIYTLDGNDCSFSDQQLSNEENAVSPRPHASKDFFDDDNCSATDRPQINYHHVLSENDPSPDQSLLGPLDADQYDNVCEVVEVIETTAGDNGLVDVYKSNLNDTLHDHMDNFCLY